ncbi:MAG TPA: S1C family serine protease [Terriglobales bacterium]|nr:S1C family serine protease [Terriglobales bacterium]
MNASLHLLHRLTTATVGIDAKIRESHPSTVVLGTERQGTGVVLESANLVLTVNYLTLGAQSLTVTTTRGASFQAAVVAQDFVSGLALLESNAVAKVGLSPRHSRELNPGNDVVVVASTGKSERRTADGLLASLGGFEANWEYSLERALAITTQSPGFGGAPICDAAGKVLGVTFLDTGEVGRFTIGIPVDHYLDHRDELLEHGRRVSRPARAWIGCFCYTVREHVVIAGVLPGGPAERGGLKAGDVVIDIDAQRISGRGELYRTLWDRRPGAQVELRVYRDKGIHAITLTTASAEEFFA